MTAHLEQRVRDILRDIAPGTDADGVPSDQDLREALDLDSMDILNFAVALSKAFEVPIPEQAYAELVTIQGCVAYLQQARATPSHA